MSVYYVAGMPYSDELYHFGIKGQKWGIRRYQNEDGTLTPAGKARYGTEVERMAAKDAQRVSDAKVAYGEGAGTRRKLLAKEIGQKSKNKEYAKAFEEASKHVNVGKSLKRAESLHRHSGSFTRGRDLADRGYRPTKGILEAAGKVALTAIGTYGSYYYLKKSGSDFAANVMVAVGASSAAALAVKTARDASSYKYYERNKKF